jgi:GNAT superfamily N-acetyltransferase
MDVKTIIDGSQKAVICENILRALPEWFGIEISIVEYIKITKEMPFYAAYDDDKPVGFTAIKIHNEYSAEVCVIGILKEYHRKGIGRQLMDRCERFCLDKDIEFLTVKTLDKSRASTSYEKTRQFYIAMGFRPLEVFKTIWDEYNPCLYMAKYIKK